MSSLFHPFRFAAALMVASAAFAQQPSVVISGRVVDVQGAPVASTTVTLVELARAMTTQADGAFRFADVPAGTHTIIARRLGYTSDGRRVVAGTASANLTLVLRESA